MNQMKKLILSLVAVAFIAGTVSTSFGQVPDKQSVKARENLKEEKKDVVEAKQDLKVALKDSTAEYQLLTKESAIKFASNEKTIEELRATITKGNSKEMVNDQKKVNLLELKNNNLKKELADYKLDGQTKFPAFKAEFNRDLEQLSKELKDFKVL
jgi:ABC-type transport system involved in cytochrome bd biosynthesis fused ATPase/permease subunit